MALYIWHDLFPNFVLWCTPKIHQFQHFCTWLENNFIVIPNETNFIFPTPNAPSSKYNLNHKDSSTYLLLWINLVYKCTCTQKVRTFFPTCPYTKLAQSTLFSLVSDQIGTLSPSFPCCLYPYLCLLCTSVLLGMCTP